MSWGDIEIKIPDKDPLESISKAAKSKPGTLPAAKAKKPKDVKQELINRPATGYLTATELKKLDSKLDGRKRAYIVRKLLLEWMDSQ